MGAWELPRRHDRRSQAEALRTRHPGLVVDDPAWTSTDNGGAWTWSVAMLDGPTFTSRVELDCGQATAGNPSASLGRMLAVVDALSYWKAAVPAVLRCAFPLAGSQEWWGRFMAGSMAEFLWSNGLDPDWLPVLEAAGVSDLASPPASDERSVVLLHSGGKDSIAAAHLLATSGHRVRPLTYRPTAEALNVVRVSAPPGGWAGPGATIGRVLDSALLDLNDDGYLNGHTPYSAWLALAGLAVAEMTGAARVAAGNGASDDEPNIAAIHEGRPWSINHQWSKSASFETAWHEIGGGGRRYASPLRPLLELAVVAGMVATSPPGAAVALSCNRAAQAGRPAEWCGRCPKCAWTALALSAVAGRRAAVSRMGVDPLADPLNADLVAAMCGRRGLVPLECSGLPVEVRACVRALTARTGGGEPALATLSADDIDDGAKGPGIGDLVGRIGPAPLLGTHEMDATRTWSQQAGTGLDGAR